MTKKYIDAEKLKSIIKAHLKERDEWMKDPDKSDRQDQLWADLNGEDVSILLIIDSLQKEKPEVNLEKEIEKALDNLTTKDLRGWFRYFYEIGLKIGKEE